MFDYSFEKKYVYCGFGIVDQYTKYIRNSVGYELTKWENAR